MSFKSMLILWCGLLSMSKARRNEPPYFVSETQWQMYENEKVGARPRSALVRDNYVVLSAYDPDGDPLTFRVKGDEEKSFFTVDLHSGIVKLRKTFDREIQETYTAQFIVSDSHSERTISVDITILDVNDNRPMFEQSRYDDVSIPENLPIDSEVFQVTATDPDTGNGGLVTYSIVNEDGPGPFQVGSSSGIIFLRENIDYEDVSTYRLVIAARDRDPTHSLSSSVVVTINLEDVQDTDPIFEDLPYDRTIDENAAMRTMVVTVRALDGDRGQPNEIGYSIVSGNEDGAFTFSAGVLRIAKRIDRDVPGFDGVYKLTVRAFELPIETRQGSSVVSFKIKINDLNDERPSFERSSYRFSLPESTPVGTSLPIAIPVSDEDQGANSDVTMSVDWSNKDFITISPVTFRGHADVTIILTKALDFETNRKRQFKIFANETNNPRLFTICDIRIDIQNENDNAPIFDQVHYQKNVPESTSLDRPILRVLAEDADAGRAGRVVYSVENSRGEIEIHRNSGDIRLLMKLDYEESRIKQYVITATDLGSPPLTARSLVTINVVDENDNAPVFPVKLADAFVRENTTEKGIATIKATDADTFPHNVITYALEEGPFVGHFMLETENNFGILSLNEPLDYESIDGGKVLLTVNAVDSGHLLSSAPIVVNVEDVNDHEPQFVSISNLTVLENIGGGIPVGSVRATDGDSGKNGKISYYITSGQEHFSTVFQLNEDTGDITTKPGTSPNYEEISAFEVAITAQDGGTPSMFVSRSLRIDVIDVNDNAPVFDKSIYETTIEENSVLRNFRVTATDADSGFNGAVRYFITNGNLRNVFDINDITGYLTNKKKLDYEILGQRITLEVTAEDLGQKKLHSSTKVVINIVDVNDNAPVFRGSFSRIYTVVENTVGPAIGSFLADDADSGSAGRVTYSITEGNEKGRFSISPLDGELRVASSVQLDREEQEYYNLTICATDGGSNPHNESIQVRIKVGDVNDNTPEFVDLPSRLNVSENRIALAIYTLEGEDRDAGNFGEVDYAVDNEDGIFVVHSQTGVIDLVKTLDREVNNEYVLHVTVRDNPRNPKDSRRTTKSILVAIDDANDETPRFVGSIPYQATIPENSPPGSSLVFTTDPILALDDDEGRNAIVTYTIEGEGSSFFSIDSETGHLQTTTSLDRESLPRDVIDLSLRASDVGGLYSETVVTVTVSDVNDNSPKFAQHRMNSVILESAQPGRAAAQMSATDPDLGLNGQIFYRIKSGAYDKFTINPDSGIVYLAPGQSLDRESTPFYKLIIEATDHAPLNTKSSTATVLIDVYDVNDSRPKFTTNYQKLAVQENSAVGTTITKLTATDDDLDSDLTFIMTSISIFDDEERQIVADTPIQEVARSDNDMILSWFTLNSTSGEITLSSSDEQEEITVDRELCSKVYLNFMVRDQASATEEMANALQSMTLQIDIADQNDNFPIFEIPSNGLSVKHDEVVVDVTEECVIGTRLFSVMARDKDQGRNGEVVFELQDNPGRLVRLANENSGTIVSSGAIDRESLAPGGGSGWINVTLLARDRGFVSSRSSVLSVCMRVIDVNDNNPKFLQGFYEESVYEDASIGDVVLSVTANDADDDDFGEVSYKSFGAMGNFVVHPRSGEISVARKLDREVAEQHVFTVVARDNQRGIGESRDTTVQVTVTLRDVNDNSPVFIQPKQPTITIFENTTPGKSITMVTATDSDEGTYGQVTYSLRAFADFFAIDPYSGDVTVSREVVVSRRHPMQGNVTITATDGGGRETSLDIQIEIIDVNDHFPQFVAPVANVIKILEEQPGGLLVTQVNATDDDIGLNGIVRYRLVDPNRANENAFYINDVSGIILTARKLDRETRQSFTLVIEAHDLGTPSRQRTKFLTVVLQDIDDNRPIFETNDKTGATQTISVSEDAAVGSTVGHVTSAIDHDENARIYYHILTEDGDMVRKTFKLEGKRLVLKRKLDREATDQYTLIIGATNNKKFTTPFTKGMWDATVQQNEPAGLSLNHISSPLSLVWDPSLDPTLMRLIIEVNDVIDSAPKFVLQHYVTALEANSEVGSRVAKVKRKQLYTPYFITNI